MKNGDRSKSCQQGNSTYGPSTIWNSFAFRLPKEWPFVVIDLKDCFFTIPLQEKNRKNSQPTRRYQ